MQSKIKFPEKMRLKLYRSTFLQNINVLIVNTVQLDDFRSDQSTRFGRPQIITRISRLAGLAVKTLASGLPLHAWLAWESETLTVLPLHSLIMTKRSTQLFLPLQGLRTIHPNSFSPQFLYTNDKRP